MSKFAFSVFIMVLAISLSLASDILGTNRSITYGETLVSSDLTFELGFFSPGNLGVSYLGIWFKFSPETVVWVANRNNPLANRSGVLRFSDGGNLVVLNQSNAIVWSSESSRVLRDPIAQLLDSGNLILRDESSSSSNEAYSWQSLDYPSDTLLSGMKLGFDLKTGLKRRLTAWKSKDDPSLGDYVNFLNFSQGLFQSELVQVYERRIIFRTGQWNGIQFVGIPPAVIPNLVIVHDETENSLIIEVRDSRLLTTIKLSYGGLLHVSEAARTRSVTWNLIHDFPSDWCDLYAKCGANAICRPGLCRCMKGFIPKSLDEWAVLNFSSGCKRARPTNCLKGDGFWKIKNVKLPDLLEVTSNKSMSLTECEAECLRNCSCTAYANADIRGGGWGCLMWFGDLIDMTELEEQNNVQTLYIRLSASEIGMHSHSNRLNFLLNY